MVEALGCESKKKVRILDFLREAASDKSITEIAQATEINRNTVSTYLRVLEAEGKVDVKRTVGRAKMYQLLKQDHATGKNAENMPEPFLQPELGTTEEAAPERFPELTRFKRAKLDRDRIEQEINRLKEEFDLKDAEYNSFRFRVLHTFYDREIKSIDWNYPEGRIEKCSYAPSVEWLERRLEQGFIEIISP